MLSKLIIATALASFVTVQLRGWLEAEGGFLIQIRNLIILSSSFLGFFIITSHLLKLREFTELYQRKIFKSTLDTNKEITSA
jgi:hypothetical protein